MTSEAATRTDRALTPSGLPVGLEGVSVQFSPTDHPVVALRDLTLDIPAGSLTVIIGPNGCGKSTLRRVIAGLLQPVAGRAAIGDGAGACQPIHAGPIESATVSRNQALTSVTKL